MMRNLNKIQALFVGILAVLIGIAEFLLRPSIGGHILTEFWVRTQSLFALLMLLAIIFWANKNKHTFVLHLAFVIFWTILLSL